MNQIPIKTIQKGMTKVMRKGNYQETAQKGISEIIPKLTKKQMKMVIVTLERAGQSKEEIEKFRSDWNAYHHPKQPEQP